MKIIQITASQYEVYGLDDEGNIYVCERVGAGFNTKWKLIKLEL